MHKFKFADIGEGLHEGVVAEIYKNVGDEVKEGDSLFSVETDKVTSDIPSPATGKIVKILMAVGDTIHVGQEIYYIDDGSGDTEETTETASSQEVVKEEAPQEGGASVVGEVKVSNDLFDLSAFVSPSTSSEAKPAKKTFNRFAKKDRPTKTTATTLTKPGKETGKLYDKNITETFDVIVIGSGPGGYLAAEEAGKAGLKTLIVEKEFWGGVCLNVGCIPTKALLKTAEIYHSVKHAHEYGIVGQVDVKIDWSKMHERKSKVVSQLTNGIQALMRMNKVKTIFGSAKFVGAHEIEVENKVYRGKNIIVATGSSDRELTLPGFEQGYKTGKLITSKEAINLKEKPKSLTIVGGGVIGVEFAQIFAAAGTKVVIIQNMPTVLAMLDQDIIKQVSSDLKELGVDVITNANTTKFENDTLYYEVDGKEHLIKSDVTLVSVGRVPSSLGLEEVGIKLGSRKELLIDEFCETNVEGVYGIGDVVGQAMLAHVAYRHAVVAVSNILKKTVKFNAKTVPACIYTSPEIASVGLTEQQAKDAKLDFISVKHQFSFIGKALAANEPKGFAKFIIDKEYGEIIGCHIIGGTATDLISEVVLAIENEISIYEIASAVHPHPTFSEVLWEAARSAVHQLEKFKK
ncbi:dihydrolipoyl dehydrogenase [Mesomycoplasma neurolyticum]|uniref:Dihydrolipoyl dehydrogenase n=1 Tax=Mesomycoplasma neurolyticum TaxID=2120 RepID=A0A449A486_9BACT|nr:dihydrolipoyl dehydrogenase [Mesomycoplasma neurolyticum]VEU59056.1 pyruvate dehydrogenase E2 component [Mesomycoplasma neurolyticum]